MAIALEQILAQQVEEMSKIMLANREEVLQETQIAKLLAVYQTLVRR